MRTQEIIAELAKLDRKDLQRVDTQLHKLLDAAPSEKVVDVRAKPIWEIAAEIEKSVPQEEWKKLPKDGAVNVDHYLYGHPKTG